jgi:hypothetical protein
MPDVDGISLPRPRENLRRLVGKTVDDQRTFAFDTGVPAAPSPFQGFFAPNRDATLGDRFGNWTPSPDIAPRTQNRVLPPLPSNDTAPPLMPDPPQWRPAPSYREDYRQYFNQLDRTQPPAFVGNPSNLSQFFTPPNYYAPLPDDNLQRWITSLAGRGRE